MVEKEIKLWPWQEIVGVCKDITDDETQTAIRLLVNNKIVKICLNENEHDFPDREQYFEKIVALLRTDSRYLIRKIVENGSQEKVNST